MKKLTKRVTAGGLLFDVEPEAKFIVITPEYFDYPSVAVAVFDNDKPEIKCSDSYALSWNYKNGKPICRIQFEGTDWRECCWYVGDQVDGEVAERREWMARGAETVVSRLENGVVGADKYEGVCSSIKIGRVTIGEIRSGEIDL